MNAIESRRTPRALTVLAAAVLCASTVVAAGPASAATATVTAAGAATSTPSQETVPPHGLPQDWVARGSGYFRTSDPSDLLHYEVQRHAVSPAVVEFRLQAFNRCLWNKTLVMPDGLGSRWDITIDPSQGRFSAANGLWADQVHNGQSLELWKAGFLGFKHRVLEISDLGALEPGSRVVFTWIQDSWHCGS